MAMSLLDETFEVYVQMRTGGKEAKACLDALRTRIELMDTIDRMEMVRRVKTWETLHQGNVPRSAKAAAAPTPAAASVAASQPSALPNVPIVPRSDKSVLCPRCGKPNNVGEVFCVHCGNFLRTDVNPHETTRLHQTADGLGHGSDYFGPDSSLVLTVATDNFSYTVQPQRFKHETVIGRSEGSTMKPDLDLSTHNASEMGVSRLHVALQYNAKNNLLSVSDMKSANGTFINGQKLYPQEVRVLRDGDELRLGVLVLRCYFTHPVTSSLG